MNKILGRSEATPSEISLVELTRCEGLGLSAFLEQIKSSDSEDSENTLATVLRKLCEADTIALWLRENVSIKLTHKEVADILKRLESSLEESASKCSLPLETVARKLNEVF